MIKYFIFILAVLLTQQTYSANDPISVAPPSLMFELLGLNGDLETVQKPKYLTTTSMVVSPDKKSIYICAQSAKQVLFFSVATNSVTQSVQMPNEPTGAAVSSDGSRLYVTCSSERWPNGMVCVVNTTSGTIEKRIKVGHMARCPVLNPDNSKLFVCNWLENTISFIELSSGTEIKRVPAIKEPYSIALSKTGDFLLVANMIPDGAATDTAMTCKVCFINTSTGQLQKTVRLPTGSHSTMNICLTPDGKYALIPHLIGRVTLPATTLAQGWVHSNNLAIIDMVNQTLYNDVELDDASQGFANPWSVAWTDDSKWLCIAFAGYNAISVIDMNTLFTKLAGKGDVSHEFTFTQGFKKVVPLTVLSPRSVVTIGSKAYICGYFSQSLNMVDLSATTITPTSYTLAAEKPMTNERKGERYFIDGNQCDGHWQSCHSCHPFTRPDGLNWILFDSYKGSAPKNAKSMLLAFQTPPPNWAFKRNNAFESVRAGIELELKIQPGEDVATALDTFLMRLKPVPSPLLVKGKLSESAQRGRVIFYNKNKVNCLYCHPAPLFTDLTAHTADIPDSIDNRAAFFSPSLIECWRTGPYDHLGSHEKIEDITTHPGHSSNVSNLSGQEFKDLIEYILSL
jgi:DNA-binding beta-propeller fold protein YncE